jgi:hypothetical protein
MAKVGKKSKPTSKSRKAKSKTESQSVSNTVKPKVEQGEAQLKPESHIAANAYIVSPPSTKHGPRAGGKIKYAQLAILEIYGRPVEHVNSKIVQKVSDHLEKHSNPDCRAVTPISRKTVERANKTLLEINRER